jgi:hypothetical protein
MRKFYNKFIRQVRRRIKTPFKDKSRKKLIVHCTHHKAGTVWLHRVLKSISNYYGLRLQHSNIFDDELLPLADELKPSTDIYFQPHSLVRTSILPPFRGSHLIRDPRDIIISGYFYHLWTEEEWARTPIKGYFRYPKHWPYFSPEEFGNLSYQQYLNSLDEREGILVEIRRSAGYNIKHMAEWDYSNPDFIEVKYENLMTDWKSEFTNIFNHYEFNQKAIDISLEIADKYRFENVAKRKVGEVNKKSHLRSGKIGQWKKYFTDSHKVLFKDLFGDALIRMGYESNNDW